MILNLDNTFNPWSSNEEIQFEHFTFSGGEPHIKILSDLTSTNEVKISHRIRSFNDLGVLLLAVDALRRMSIENISLFLPYFPGARQDRIMVKGEALTVKIYAQIINSLNLNEVIIFDPHSEVTSALINNCKIIENHDFIKKIICNLDSDTLLISPDGGALKKIYKLAYFLEDYEVIECSKSRDIKTRRITKFKVYADDLKGKDCLIIDDICDGGRTFIGLAKELKQKNCGKLFLAVSHGIFSHGTEELFEYFDGIFTTNAFGDNKDSKLNIFELKLK